MGVDFFGRPFGTFGEVAAEVAAGKAQWPVRVEELERRLAEADVPSSVRSELEKELRSIRAAMRLDSAGG